MTDKDYEELFEYVNRYITARLKDDTIDAVQCIKDIPESMWPDIVELAFNAIGKKAPKGDRFINFIGRWVKTLDCPLHIKTACFDTFCYEFFQHELSKIQSLAMPANETVH
jgi:hypothetical protein